jgi:hypothetical protein
MAAVVIAAKNVVRAATGVNEAQLAQRTGCRRNLSPNRRAARHETSSDNFCLRHPTARRIVTAESAVGMLPIHARLFEEQFLKNNFPAYARDSKPRPLTVNCSDGTSVRGVADRP